MPKNNNSKFTEDEIKVIQSATLRVWDEVAYDCLQATAEEKGKDINTITIPRSQVIEIALDAGRPEQIFRSQLGSTKLNNNPTVTEDFIKRYGETDYKELIKLVKPAFPYSRYGL